MAPTPTTVPYDIVTTTDVDTGLNVGIVVLLVIFLSLVACSTCSCLCARWGDKLMKREVQRAYEDKERHYRQLAVIEERQARIAVLDEVIRTLKESPSFDSLSF
ncbi:hypothetical protein L596_000357 [Steinernema carpocapsae]|uniref:Uncharacterized protein n=1 Tax=Steinernema carpocapsae TaxID=34508 RepID=A0A4U8UJA7_STECR|nr:hypothetical protein L596_000357 [Steinernema carpocapsae]